jgi:hypothetical protein
MNKQPKTYNPLKLKEGDIVCVDKGEKHSFNVVIVDFSPNEKYAICWALIWKKDEKGKFCQNIKMEIITHRLNYFSDIYLN